MWILILILTAIVAVDIYARLHASTCDGCKRKFYDAWSEFVFWQDRVQRAADEYSDLVKKDGEKSICVGCVEVRRTMRQIQSLEARGEQFRQSLRNAQSKVDGTIKAELNKILRASNDANL